MTKEGGKRQKRLIFNSADGENGKVWGVHHAFKGDHFLISIEDVPELIEFFRVYSIMPAQQHEYIDGCCKNKTCQGCNVQETFICEGLVRQNNAAIAQAAREDEREKMREVVKLLYDAGFNNPLIIVECTIEYLKNPTIPGHPELQKVRSSNPAAPTTKAEPGSEQKEGEQKWQNQN